VHEEVQGHNKVVAKLREADPVEWESLVAAYRRHLTPDFFAHVETLVLVAKDSEAERAALVTLASRVFALVEVYDKVSADAEAMDAAAAKFDDLLQVTRAALGEAANRRQYLLVAAESVGGSVKGECPRCMGDAPACYSPITEGPKSMVASAAG
jgi:hypothetical protein